MKEISERCDGEFYSKLGKITQGLCFKEEKMEKFVTAKKNSVFFSLVNASLFVRPTSFTRS